MYSEIKRKKSLKLFLEEFIETNPSTFGDKELKILNFPSGRRRSIDALYKVAKTEYPSISFRKFINIFANIVKNSNRVIFVCNDIKKMVISKPVMNNSKLFFQSSESDTNTIDKYTGPYIKSFLND